LNSVFDNPQDVDYSRLFEKAIVVGLHIPKCAGTTFALICRQHFPPHQFYRNSDPIGFHQKRHPEFTALNFSNVRAIFGHFVFEEMLKFIPSYRAVVLFTGLRDPVERARSEFYFVRKFSEDANRTPPPFEEWVRYPRNQNNMCDYLVKGFPSFIDADAVTLSEKAISVLQKFDLVYDTRSFDQEIEIIYQILGVKSTTDRFNITKDEQKTPVSDVLLREHNLEDVALYEYYLDHSELVPRDLNELHRRVSANHRLRTSILGYEPDLHTMYQNLYSRKKGVYSFTGKLREIVTDKICEIHSLAFELGCYIRDGDEIVLNPDEVALLKDLSFEVQSLLQSETSRSKIETRRIRQQHDIEQELHTVRRELNAIYASRGYRMLEKLKAIRRKLFKSEK
jgi:hypothetical protein